MLNFYCCFIDCNGYVQCTTIVEGKLKGCIIFEVIVKFVLTEGQVRDGLQALLSDMAKVLIQRELKKYEVDVKAIEQSIVFTHDPNDFLVNGMLELLDQYYRLEKSFSTKK